MKIFPQSTVFLALATIVSAIPAKRQSSCILQTVKNPDTVEAVKASIQQWNDDVNTVNSFLNAAPDLLSSGDIEGIKSQAQTALMSASDEPCQLMTLGTQTDLISIDAFDCAVADLMNVFGDHVLDPLNRIITSPNVTTIVQSAVHEINAFRCCNVLPDVDILFLLSADDSGISDQVPTSVDREDACSSMGCTGACKALDGANGY